MFRGMHENIYIGLPLVCTFSHIDIKFWTQGTGLDSSHVQISRLSKILGMNFILAISCIGQDSCIFNATNISSVQSFVL